MVHTYVTTKFKIIQNYHTNIKADVYGEWERSENSRVIKVARCQGTCTIVLTLVNLTITPTDRKDYEHTTLFATSSVCNSKF